jgi:nitronate monooxygenase
MILGAQAVQIGSGFLITKESGASESWKKAMVRSNTQSTMVTDRISGRKARGIKNLLIDNLIESGQIPYEYPIQNNLTKDIRSIATLNNNHEYQSLYCGQGVECLNEGKSVKEFI